MSRLTGTDAYGLMEAYSQVYDPQELTEEQVWEEVENWVNSLLEEGYDLSEYTWEDMYEEYLNEYAAGGVPGSGGAVTMYSRPVANTGQSYQSRFARPRNAGTSQYRSSVNVGNLGAGYRGQELQAGARARASQVGTPRQGSAGTGAAPSAAAPRPVARPAATAPAARPAASPSAVKTTPARPATPTYAGAQGVKPVGTSVAGSFKPVAGAPSQNATFSAPAKPVNKLMTGMPTVPSMAAPAGGPKLSARAQALKAGGPAGSARERMLNQDLDLFDVIKGHLLDEGYADSEEAALTIMANMSEEWRESIMEREMDEPGERDDRPDVKAHNRAVGYRPRPRRPRIEDDPRYGTTRDRGGN